MSNKQTMDRTIQSKGSTLTFTESVPIGRRAAYTLPRARPLRPDILPLTVNHPTRAPILRLRTHSLKGFFGETTRGAYILVAFQTSKNFQKE